MGSTGMKALCRALSDNVFVTYLVSLHIVVTISRIPGTWRIFCTSEPNDDCFLLKNLNTKILNISHSSVLYSFMKKIRPQLLRASLTVVFQDVSENNAGSDGAKYLFRVLASNPVLLQLHAEANNFNENDANYVYDALLVRFH